MKFKFELNDLIMYYKIINLLVHIKGGGGGGGGLGLSLWKK